MSNIEITIRLPEELVKQARESRMLTDEKIAELLQNELDRRDERQKHLHTFIDKADQLAAAEPKLTLEEIEAEIEAARRL
jgi:hypothetical protein